MLVYMTMEQALHHNSGGKVDEAKQDQHVRTKQNSDYLKQGIIYFKIQC